MNVSPIDIVGFWRDAGYQKWFTRNDDFDAELRRRFEAAHYAAARRELESWMDNADSALALIILLDQYPRNCFRRSGHAYATDSLARHYAARAVDAGFDAQVDPVLRVFFYLPFEHSENMADQERSVELTRALDGEFMKYALAHRDAIARFGRFPHRNRELGRTNTPEEQAYLDAGGGFAG
ncbi:DUF924 family protein [Luteimonas sp. SX5]|uniref:DUF924 family protein n=1 Tax=Luteimonas galliterrae TaxID=2940486 RepID=A0ABT0MLH9_9GAMM|nr:DUF924 family protein [Luteimonas galliterrae]MCL1635750.1 DUF924 family protein [Luteimonas galliterrae]